MSESDRVTFVDLQGFVINNHFVLKELCFSIRRNQEKCVDNDIPSHHFVFREPFSWKFVSDMCKKRAIWLTAFHHGFYWKQGDTSYEKISTCIAPLMEKDLIIYVKGQQKIDWLKQLCGNREIDCRNIEDYGCKIHLSDGARNEHFQTHCNKHRKSNQCALRNVKQIEDWYFENYTNINYNDQSSSSE
jgi:hypothetical protein